MSITYRQGEGSKTAAQRNNLGIAAGVVTTNLGLTTPLIGDIIELNSTGAGNDGFYTYVALAAANQYQLRPAPANQAAAGTANVARLNRAAAYTMGATTITSITLVPGPDLLAIIQVTGANFVTVGVQNNDRVPVSGNAFPANNGAWIVHRVLSEDAIVVRSPDGGAGMTAEAVGTGFITGTGAVGNTSSVRRGVNVFRVTNEVALSWSQFRSVGAPLAAPVNSFGSGRVGDYVKRNAIAGTLNGNNRYMVLLEGVSSIEIDQAGLVGDSAWASLNELVVDNRNLRPGSTGNLGEMNIAPATTGWAGVLTLTLGSSLEPLAAREGSYWIGVRWNASTGSGFQNPLRGRIHAYGSLWDPVTGILNATTGSLLWLGSGGNASAILARGGVVAYDGVIESPIVYDGTAFYALMASGGVQNNVLVASSDGSGIITVAATIGGLLFSGDRAAVLLNNASAGGLLVILDPRADYDLVDFISNTGGGASTEKHYTFNPRFTDGAAEPPTPIAGLLVVITEVHEATFAEVVAFSGLTDAGGFINGGFGVALRRQRTASAVNAAYYHRITVSGAGFPAASGAIQIRSPMFDDFPVPHALGALFGVPPVVDVVTVPTQVIALSPTVRVDPETGTVEVIVL